MKPEIVEIIKELMKCRDENDEKYIAISILSLKDRWPNLTEDEKKEIDASAYSIYYLDSDVSPNGDLDGKKFPECLDDAQTNDIDDELKRINDLIENNEINLDVDIKKELNRFKKLLNLSESKENQHSASIEIEQGEHIYQEDEPKDNNLSVLIGLEQESKYNKKGFQKLLSRFKRN